MTATIWTGKVRRQMFEWLPKIKVNDKVVGYYAPGWTNKPSHFTVKEWDQVELILFNKLTKANTFPKTPKTFRAVGMQLCHALLPQNNPQFRKTRAALRFAAYYAGFMEMTDIVELENRAREKHGIRVDIEGNK